MVKLKGNGKLTFTRDGDLVLKNGGVLNVQNNSFEFNFENVRMNNGFLKLTNSNFNVSGDFKTENNSQIILKADNNKANIKAKNINLDTLNKLEVDNYTLKSTENFKMSSMVDGNIKNSSLISDKDMTIENLTANFTSSTLQTKDKLSIKNNKGKFNQTDIKSTDGDVEISG